MNLDQIKDKKPSLPLEDIDFDFKPITSGLGFHHQKATDVKPVITERTVAASTFPSLPLKKEANVYQNDLSLFYGHQKEETSLPVEPVKEEKYYRPATKPQRFFAYVTDLLFVVSILGVVLTVMARTISMDLMEVWSLFPNEITPLVVTLFCGFYLMYFSIFEKASQSTMGKNLFGLRVMSMDDRSLSLSTLLLRSMISLLNFVSLGLFSYFDLQNKVTNSKVVRID
jgi:uncharacterized RDD family membrane protein YckC